MNVLKKFKLGGTFYPKHHQNKMKNEGKILSARNNFLLLKPTNLDFLLQKRYSWMNKYLDNKSSIYELGCGAGFSKEYIKNKQLKLTDLSDYAWVDIKVDALNLPFKPSSIDAFVCSHMIHHLANPYNFLVDAGRCLKPGGLIIISEVNSSIFLKLLLRLMCHEGWSYDVDVFSSKSICNDPSDLWSANCAIPEMLFKNRRKFETYFPELKIIHYKLTEFLIFSISGGVIAKTKTINLNKVFLRMIDLIDTILIRLFPNIFPMGVEIVIQKSK